MRREADVIIISGQVIFAGGRKPYIFVPRPMSKTLYDYQTPSLA